MVKKFSIKSKILFIKIMPQSSAPMFPGAQRYHLYKHPKTTKHSGLEPRFLNRFLTHNFIHFGEGRDLIRCFF